MSQYAILTSGIKLQPDKCLQSIKRLKHNTVKNLDLGTKACPILSEGRDIIESKDANQLVSATGLLALYTISKSVSHPIVNLKSGQQLASNGMHKLAAVYAAASVADQNSNSQVLAN